MEEGNDPSKRPIFYRAFSSDGSQKKEGQFTPARLGELVLVLRDFFDELIARPNHPSQYFCMILESCHLGRDNPWLRELSTRLKDHCSKWHLLMMVRVTIYRGELIVVHLTMTTEQVVGCLPNPFARDMCNHVDEICDVLSQERRLSKLSRRHHNGHPPGPSPTNTPLEESGSFPTKDYQP